MKDWQTRFSVGQVIDARVLSANTETNQIELTLRTGDIQTLLKRSVGLSNFTVGQKVEGRVKSVMDFGLFIEVVGTKISGLCHKSEVCPFCHSVSLFVRLTHKHAGVRQ